MSFTKSGHETICDPPSFYEDDCAKWATKFRATIADREKFKKKYFSERANLVLTSNDNVKDEGRDLDNNHKNNKYTAG